MKISVLQFNKSKQGRKIVALALMSVLISGSVSFNFNYDSNLAYAQTNPNLFVSAENTQFKNYMSGPQVVEVVIIDPNLRSTDQGKGEPDVTINGNDLRMIQATDGNWYAYFAERKQATIADSTVGLVGKGLDFGTFCSGNTSILGFSVSDSVGIAIPIHGSGVGGQNGQAAGSQITKDCFFSEPKSKGAMNVLREPKAVNTNPNIPIGQIGLQNKDLWPFIQLYNFNDGGNIVIKYNKGGGTQIVTLTFDSAEQFSKVELDRSKYPRRAQVHATITDLNLNIDPTDEDSWTFGTLESNPSIYYQLFNENGETDADGTAGAVNIRNSLGSLMFETSGVLKINAKSQDGTSNIITIRDNQDSKTNGDGIKLIASIKTDGGSILAGNQPVTVTEMEPNKGVFVTYDNVNESVLVTTPTAERGKSATIDYNKKAKSILIEFGTATFYLDERFKGNEWNSGEELPIILIDSDANKNTISNEDLDLFNPDVEAIPSLSTGDPFTLGESGVEQNTKIKATFLDFFNLIPSSPSGKSILDSSTTGTPATVKVVEKFSERARIIPNTSANVNALVIDLATDMDELRKSINNPFSSGGDKFRGINMFNYDIRSLNSTISNVQIYLLADQTSTKKIINDDGTLVSGLTAISLVNVSTLQNLVNLNSAKQVSNPEGLHNLLFGSTLNEQDRIGLMFTFSEIKNIGTEPRPIVADFFSFGIINDGVRAEQRIANQIIRLELEEEGKNVGDFRGSLEYIMLNQLNVLDPSTYEKIVPIDDEPVFVLINERKGSNAIQVSYNDLNKDGAVTAISDQQDVLTHTGVVSLNARSFKVGDTVTVNLIDKDLNTNSDLIDVYTVVDPNQYPSDPAADSVGKPNLGKFVTGQPFGTLLEITFDDERWVKSTVSFNGKKCSTPISGGDGLFSTGFTLVETGQKTGEFTGQFQIPSQYCSRNQGGSIKQISGVDIEANYFDFRGGSGQMIETGTSSGVRGSSGSVSLDRTVYPVPFGSVNDFFDGAKSSSTRPDNKSIFPVHLTGISKNGAVTAIDAGSEEIGPGDLTIHVRVNDPDFNTSPKGGDRIAQKLSPGETGPVKVMVKRGANTIVLATAGSDSSKTGVITSGPTAKPGITREVGPISETSPDSGIFEFDFRIRYTDGPASTKCPDTPSSKFTILDKSKSGVTARFETVATSGNYCILQGDILTVEYKDPTDASGKPRIVTDSASFDLRNGVLQSDKAVYIIGTDMILTVIDPDLNLDSDQAETYSLDLIKWDSSAAKVTMGTLGGSATLNGKIFDPEPVGFREIGDNAGVFQSVIEIPSKIGDKNLNRGEKIKLEYTDWGSSGADFVGQDDEDVIHTIFTSNFGATIELDHKVYTWTDKVYITIVAPDHNFDSNRIDEIGGDEDNEINISTRSNKLTKYRLAETGTDTGVFAGEVILTGFRHDADGDIRTGDVEGIDSRPRTEPKSGGGPTNGFLEAKRDDGLSVSFEFSEREVVIGSALIRWNIGQIDWLKGVNLKDGMGIIQVIDPDMNLNPEGIDNFSVDVWSDTDLGGIDLKVTETDQASGIFEGFVYFTTKDQSSGNRLRVSEGDFVTAKYEDNTLPAPFTTADELKITANTFIGTFIPTLERAPVTNPRILGPLGNPVTQLYSGIQAQVASDLRNDRGIEQPFIYIVQIKNEQQKIVSLAWLAGKLTVGQTINPSLSWIPIDSGNYTVEIFVWESLVNPVPLSPPIELIVEVQ